MRWAGSAMGGEWEWKPLAALSINHDARRLPVKESDRRSGEYPYYGASGIVDYVDGYLFDGEYLLVAEDGENLRTRQTPIAFIARGRFWVNNHAHVIEANSENLTRYLSYALQQADITAYLTGAVMPKLTQANLNRILVPAPPLRAQRHIVELLGSLDDKIELNRRIAETLERMARAIFKSWFVDFDPVRAKAEGRPTGLPDDLAALFPDRFGKGGLPEGWTTEPFSRLFEISGGNTPSTEDATFWGGLHQWATPKDLSALQSPVLLQTARRLTDAGLQTCSSGLLPVGSLLLSSRAPIGYMAFVTQPTAINQGFAGIIKRRVSTTYAWAWCAANMDMITGNAGGSTFPEISKSVLRQLPMLAPPLPVLDAFAKIAEALVGRITASAQEAQTLATLRDTLLPKLISGELRIADAEQRIAAA